MIDPGARLRKAQGHTNGIGRMRLTLLVIAIAAISAFMPATASANLTNSVTQTFGNTIPGAPSDYTVDLTFGSYSDVPSGDPGTSGDDLKQWVVESPAGGVGNPNAIPAASRCDLAEFENAMANPETTVWATLCGGYSGSPAQVGDSELELGVDADDSSATTLSGNIFLLSGSPEVPAKLGTIYPTSAPGGTTAEYSLDTITPITSEDFRLQTVSETPLTRPIVAAGPTYGHVKRILFHMFGTVGGVTFMTNPTRCDNWVTYAFGQAYDSTTNADSDPLKQGSNTFVKSASAPVTPDCSTLPKFSPSATVTLSTNARDSNPQVDFTVTSGSPSVDYPKKLVTTMPASITTDLQGIGNPCEVANRNSNTCPAASKVGTAKVTTPLLTAGLTGDVYMVRGDGKAIPDLAIFFNSPPNSIPSFRLDGTTKFVGPNGNQIETTFDNGPQAPFSTFTVTINGGTDTLLTISRCPDGSASPQDGPFTFAFTGYSGQAVSNSTTKAFADCFGVSKLKKIRRCLTSKLKVSPSYDSRGMLAKSELWIKRKGGKKYRLTRRLKDSPFRFNVKLSSSLRSGTHKYKVRAVYKRTGAHPTPKVIQRYSRFRKC